VIAHDHWRGADGELGLFTLEFWPADPVDAELVALAFRLVQRALPFTEGRLRYHPSGLSQERLAAQQAARLRALAVPLIDTDALFGGQVFAMLNPGSAVGRLRVLDGVDPPPVPPTARDVVVYRIAPNDLSHVAGVITAEPQTPLSHINLIARQNQAPNAYLRDAAQDPRVRALEGQLVRLSVSAAGLELQPATQAEADAAWGRLRPRDAQRPRRDLRAREIKALKRIRWSDRHAFGAKTASVAELGRLEGVRAPDGYGVPYSFYDRFMTETGLYDVARALIAAPDFQADPALRKKRLKALRKQIKSAPIPLSLLERLEAMHDRFPVGRPLRCRSSANNEDLEGFCGAGLYDSKTHRPDEGSIGKTIRQVWAGLWTFRAFEERSFYRIDHLKAAMGVLVHPNFDDELANGVAVSRNLLAPQFEGIYVNVQRGEDDPVTTPLGAQPDELIVAAIGDRERGAEVPTGNRRARETIVLRRSSLVGPGESVLTPAQLLELDVGLRTIHTRFAKLHRRQHDTEFAVDVEFKVDAAGQLVFKQARPFAN
jgi:hypothetical protein